MQADGSEIPKRRKDRPLEGVRVVDFTWVRAGPWAARWLATLGAEVIKVEWPENMDMLRQNRFTVPPGVEPGPNSTGQFADTNAGKLGLSINVRHPKGLSDNQVWDGDVFPGKSEMLADVGFLVS